MKVVSFLFMSRKYIVGITPHHVSEREENLIKLQELIVLFTFI